MHLHEFLAEMHQVVKPKLYLEVGVQYGTSLKLATEAKVAIGIDPAPLHVPWANQRVYSMTADDYFDRASDNGGHDPIDFGFIDGLHHFEAALRDFLNIERFVHEKSVVVFDDILPRNQEEAHRTQCPGDWTGDVWKVTHLLLKYRPELQIREVNTAPTGTLVVWGFNPKKTPYPMYKHVNEYMNLDVVPEGVIARHHAHDPANILAEVEGFLK